MGEIKAMSKIFSGDCLFVMKHDIPTGSIDMVYLDPPFFTGQIQRGEIDWKPGAMEISFEDSKKFWGAKGHDDAPGWIKHIATKRPEFASYLWYMMERLQECHDILKNTGSIYLHCDYRAVHYLKMVMDEVFGVDRFLNEIIWCYKKWPLNSKKLQTEHQTILHYSKNKKYKSNKARVNDKPETAKFKDEHIWYWNATNKTILVYRREEFEKLKETSNLVIPGGKYKGESIDDWKINYVREGQALTDVWRDIPTLLMNEKEKLGYPTQKPLALLTRIIEISTDPGDLILDPFCGCATAIVAAQKLNRNWIGIDISQEACIVMKRRFETVFNISPTIIERQLNKVLRQKDENPIRYGTRFEKWVNEFYSAKKPSPDRGVDGITPEGVAIQTKTHIVDYHHIDSFVGAAKRHPDHSIKKPIKKLMFVSSEYFTPNAKQRIFQLELEGIDLHLITLRSLLGDE